MVAERSVLSIVLISALASGSLCVAEPPLPRLPRYVGQRGRKIARKVHVRLPDGVVSDADAARKVLPAYRYIRPEFTRGYVEAFVHVHVGLRVDRVRSKSRGKASADAGKYLVSFGHGPDKVSIINRAFRAEVAALPAGAEYPTRPEAIQLARGFLQEHRLLPAEIRKTYAVDNRSGMQSFSMTFLTSEKGVATGQSVCVDIGRGGVFRSAFVQVGSRSRSFGEYPLASLSDIMADVNAGKAFFTVEAPGDIVGDITHMYLLLSTEDHEAPMYCQPLWVFSVAAGEPWNCPIAGRIQAIDRRYIQEPEEAKAEAKAKPEQQ